MTSLASLGATWPADMTAQRCGQCANCITWELDFLTRIEAELWRESANDLTKYFDLMGVWGDLLIERGLPR